MQKYYQKLAENRGINRCCKVLPPRFSPIFLEDKNKKKGKINHLLVTLNLIRYISEARYVFHEHEISDHASLLFTLDIEKAEKGPVVFRANPALLKHPNYKTLINNVIRFSVVDESLIDRVV